MGDDGNLGQGDIVNRSGEKWQEPRYIFECTANRLYNELAVDAREREIKDDPQAFRQNNWKNGFHQLTYSRLWKNELGDLIMDMLTFNCTHPCGNANWMLLDVGIWRSGKCSRLKLYTWESCMCNI